PLPQAPPRSRPLPLRSFRPRQSRRALPSCPTFLSATLQGGGTTGLRPDRVDPPCLAPTGGTARCLARSSPYPAARRFPLETPVIFPADVAFMLVATALVLLMTPALAFFYGGLVRSKNALNTMM